VLKIGERYKIFLLDIVIIIASSLIFICSYLLYLIWKIEIVYSIIISFCFSIMVGILLDDYKSIFICILASLILGSAVVTLILVRPVMIAEPGKFDITLTVIVSSLAKMGLFNIVASFIGALLGFFSSGEF